MAAVRSVCRLASMSGAGAQRAGGPIARRPAAAPLRLQLPPAARRWGNAGAGTRTVHSTGAEVAASLPLPRLPPHASVPALGARAALRLWLISCVVLPTCSVERRGPRPWARARARRRAGDFSRGCVRSPGRLRARRCSPRSPAPRPHPPPQPVTAACPAG